MAETVSLSSAFLVEVWASCVAQLGQEIVRVCYAVKGDERQYARKEFWKVVHEVMENESVSYQIVCGC